MKRRNVLSLVIFCISCLSVSGQISEGGTPPSFNYPSVLRSAVSEYSVPVDLDIDRLIWEDQMAGKNGSPLRVAEAIPVDVDIKKTGQWITLPDSSKIWQQTVTADGASGMFISYSDFYIPQGGKLFIYNRDKSQILGAYNNETHAKGGAFATEAIFGDSFTLEYVESKQSQEEPRIVIESVGYVYNKSASEGGNTNLPWINSPNSTVGKGTCRINVNCIDGQNWKDQKRGVVLYFVMIGRTWYACSGSLVNNTKKDGKSYILTAWHCFDGTPNYDTLIAYFNFEFKGCANETVIPKYQTLVGATHKLDISLYGGSDSFLFQMDANNGTVPKEWKPFYNGWDRRNIAPKTGVVIHHPNKDVKKITTYTSPAVTATYSGAAANAHWQVVYNGQSVTEGGSSGSPLFNENKLIVGTLSGGKSFCETPYWPDLYGKLWYAWDQYPDNTSTGKHLKTILDPLNTGVEFLLGYDPNNLPVGVEEEIEKNKNLVLFFSTEDDELNISASSLIRSIMVYNLQGKFMFSRNGYSSSTAVVPSTGWNKGVYTVKIKTESGVFSDKFLKK